MLRILVAVAVLLVSCGAGLSEPALEIKIGYLGETPSRIRLSLIDVPAANDGLAGAQLAAEDDNATGRFLNQHYTLIEKVLGEGEDPVARSSSPASMRTSCSRSRTPAKRAVRP